MASWGGFAVAVVFGTLLHLLVAHIYGKRARDIIRNVDETAAGGFFPILFISMTIGFIMGFASLTIFAMFNLD
jgi:ABC-type transporter Mla maintaining outer membrane lipid asymmetry permease subunit MlaE